MPDPGTTDAAHILEMVKQSREFVLSSVIIQITSSVLYIVALFLLSQLFLPQKRMTLAGIIFFGIGAMGMCADAFFHLLAYYMTDSSVDVTGSVVKVMEFMQTEGVIILIPLLLPFFIGSLLLAIGLSKQKVISKIPMIVLIIAITIGPLGSVLTRTILPYTGNGISLTILALVAIAQARIGYEVIRSKGEETSSS